MKTLAELQNMSFIPHHDCACCGSMVGWIPKGQRPYFDPSCDCGSSEGHYETWEGVFKWYNTVFEKESEDAVLAAWQKEVVVMAPDMVPGYDHMSNRVDELQCEISWQLNALQCAIRDCDSKIGFACHRLDSLERFVGLNAVTEMLKNHKSNWIPNSRGGEPNHR